MKTMTMIKKQTHPLIHDVNYLQTFMVYNHYQHVVYLLYTTSYIVSKTKNYLILCFRLTSFLNNTAKSWENVEIWGICDKP